MANSLTVKVKSATGLKDKDGVLSGESDSYVRLRLVSDDDRTQVAAPRRTKVLNGSSPEWNETFTFAGLDEPGAYTLKLNVLDKDYFTQDDPLGEATVDLGKLTDIQAFQPYDDVWIDGWIFKARLNFEVSTNGGWGNSVDPASHMLRVMVKSAKGLQDKDNIFGGKVDPYVCASITDGSGSAVVDPKRTSVQQDVGGAPEWNEELVFEEGLETPCAYRLKLAIYDKDDMSMDDSLGEVTLHLGTLKSSSDEKEFDMSTDKGGRLSFSVCNMGTFGHTKPKGGAAGFCQCC